MSPSWLSKRMKDDEFKNKYLNARQGMLESAARTAQSLMTDAVSTMGEVMDNEKNSAQVRLNAAKYIISAGLRLTETTEILRRIEALEEAAENAEDNEYS